MNDRYSHIVNKNVYYMRKVVQQCKNQKKDLEKEINRIIEQNCDKTKKEESLFFALECKTFVVNENKYINYFLKDGLYDFFKNTKITQQIKDYFKKNFKCENIETHGNYATIKFESTIAGVIHSKDISDSIIFHGTQSEEIFALCIMHNETFRYINDDEEFLEYEQDQLEYFQLVLNLLFYMEAFPDKVLDSCPNEVKTRRTVKNKTIKMHESIKKYIDDNREISPHLRRGHFKFLGSDYYKKMKGKTIFVPATFVKGTAKTIIK